MPDYALFFEINEIILNLLKDFHEVEDPFGDFSEEELKRKNELVEYFELTNKIVISKIQETLNSILPNSQIYHIYLIGIKVKTLTFEFIIIHFSYESNVELTILRDKLKLFLYLIDALRLFIRKVRIFSNLFINETIYRKFLARYNLKISKFGLRFSLPGIYNVTGDMLNIQRCFLFECPYYINLKIGNLLKRITKKHFKEEFPGLLQEFPIDIDVINIWDIFYVSNEELIKRLFKEIRKDLFDKIWYIYRRVGLNIYYFSDWLSNLFLRYKKYDTKTLMLLKSYLEELKSNYFSYFPTFFIFDFDNVILQNTQYSTTGKIVFRDNNQFNKYKEKYPGILKAFHPFLLQYIKLKSNIDSNLEKINELILHKKDVISRYTKDELEEILINISNEKEFQKLLTEILYDLGYENINITCGTNGHVEHGKDIVFSNVNKFGLREWNAAIAKTGNINAEKGRELYNYVKTIINQAKDALLTEYEDDKGSKYPITRIFIVVNGNITDQAKESIRKKIEGSVFFIDKNSLLNLC